MLANCFLHAQLLQAIKPCFTWHFSFFSFSSFHWHFQFCILGVVTCCHEASYRCSTTCPCHWLAPSLSRSHHLRSSGLRCRGHLQQSNNPRVPPSAQNMGTATINNRWLSNFHKTTHTVTYNPSKKSSWEQTESKRSVQQFQQACRVFNGSILYQYKHWSIAKSQFHMHKNSGTHHL